MEAVAIKEQPEPYVRIAGPADYQECWRLLLQAFNENAMMSLAPDKVSWFLARCLDPQSIPLGDTETRGVIGVIGEPGALVGLAFLTIGELWYSHDKNIEEFLVFVDPEHRRSNNIDLLHQWMKDQVEVTGIPLISGIISNNRTEAKCRLYRRRFQKMGEFFIHFPKNWKTKNPNLTVVG